MKKNKMKISKNKLREMVKSAIKNKLKEEFSFKNEVLPKDITGYSEKVEKLIKNTIEEVIKLSDEGEEMMRSNILSSYEVQERNRFLLYYVGFLKNLAANLVHRLEDAHRQN